MTTFLLDRAQSQRPGLPNYEEEKTGDFDVAKTWATEKERIRGPVRVRKGVFFRRTTREPELKDRPRFYEACTRLLALADMPARSSALDIDSLRCVITKVTVDQSMRREYEERGFQPGDLLESLLASLFSDMIAHVGDGAPELDIAKFRNAFELANQPVIGDEEAAWEALDRTVSGYILHAEKALEGESMRLLTWGGRCESWALSRYAVTDVLRDVAGTQAHVLDPAISKRVPKAFAKGEDARRVASSVYTCEQNDRYNYWKQVLRNLDRARLQNSLAGE